MQQIKNWFNTLDDRDQKVAISAAVFVGIFLVYMVLVSPIEDSVDSLRSEVAAKQKTVNWMKQQVVNILANKTKSGVSKSNLALAAIVNNTTKKYNLPVSRRDSKNLNEMQVWFDNVAFDSFLSWVAEINTKYGVTVANVNIRSQDQDGVTSINIKLLK